MTNEQILIQSLHEIHAIRFGEFTLKSGMISPIYVDLRKIISFPNILKNIAHLMWEKVNNCNFDLICGVPYTALPIVTCMSLEHNVPMVMRRKEKKDYGTKQIVEGVFNPGQSCLIVEDIVTTGSSILETVAELEKVELKVKDVVALINSERGGKENIEKKYRLHTIFTLSEILGTLLTNAVLKPDERHIIEDYLEQRNRNSA